MKKKILIVDDDEAILDAVSLILEEAGYEVEISLKGEETFGNVSRFNPDVILLDVLMSGQDGRHICKKLKGDGETKKIPIIMMSAHPTAATSIKDCGANDFLAKPFGTEELLKKVKQNL